MPLIAKNNGWTGGQYSLFRILFGLYLFIHFMYLLPWSAELFSNQGMLTDASTSPLMQAFPNVLHWLDTAWFVQGLVGLAAIAALFFIVGYRDKWAAIFMWYILACLFSRNPLIANPSLPYTGWMLIASCFIPAAPYGSLAAKGQDHANTGWSIPNPIFIASWIVLAASYSYSGYTKLFSPAWVEGNNIGYVLLNPLARDYFLRDFFLWLPPIFLQCLTWTVMYVELLFAPLVLVPKLRMLMWGTMLIIQFGFALLLNFPDLTFAMILFHLFTFNPAWIKSKPLQSGAILYFDGNCALCHGVIRFILAEDKSTTLHFKPLAEVGMSSSDTIMLFNGNQIYQKSDAVIELLAYLGGLWRIISIVLRLFPRSLRDIGYDCVGNVRYKLFGKIEGVCPIVYR